MADSPAEISNTPTPAPEVIQETPAAPAPAPVVETPKKEAPVIAPVDDAVKTAINSYWSDIPVTVRYADIDPKSFDKYVAGADEPQQLSITIPLMSNTGRAAGSVTGDIDFSLVRGASYPDTALALHYKTILHRLSAAADAMANVQDIKNIGAYKQATAAAIEAYGAQGLEKVVGVIAAAIKKASLTGARKDDKDVPINWVKPITFGAGGAEPRGFAAAALNGAWEKAHTAALETLRSTLQKSPAAKSKERKLPMLANIAIWSRKFVEELPAESFKTTDTPNNWSGHWVTLSEADVEAKGGKELMDALRKRAESPESRQGIGKLITGADLDNYSYWYEDDKKQVHFHNKRLDNRATIGTLAKILKAFKGESPAVAAKDLAAKLNTSLEELMNYIRTKLNSLTPNLQADAEKIMKMTPPKPFAAGEKLAVGSSFDSVPFGSFPGEEATVVSVVDTPEKGYNISLNKKESFYKHDEAHKIFSSKSKLTDAVVAEALTDEEVHQGFEKKAYGDTWAGPSLDQVGALIGDYEAKWASEIAANLAGKFDYISFPKMDGGPETMRKIALRLEELELMPLSEPQQELASKLYPEALKLVRAALPSLEIDEMAHHEDEPDTSVAIKKDMPLTQDQTHSIAMIAVLYTIDKGVGGIPLPTNAPEADFKAALRTNVALITHKIHQKGWTGLPDEEVGSMDVTYVVKDAPPESLRGNEPEASSL